MTTSLRIPITNVYGGGDYTAAITVGSKKTTANVILDTGSSTLAVSPRAYHAATDTHRVATSLAQDIIYGSGGWVGPVLQTKVSFVTTGTAPVVDAYLALTDAYEPPDFGQADGILGLAYNELNNAYDLTQYLQQQGHDTAHTYPWPFRIHDSTAGVQTFARVLSRLPEQDLTPYFSAMQAAGVVKNIFAFYTLRSQVSAKAGDPLTDPANNGFFILGGGAEESDLFNGDFRAVEVVDDAWYNTNLLAVEVAGTARIDVAPLSAQDAKSYLSNSIVDTGTNGIYLAPATLNAVMSALHKLKPSFVTQIEASGQGAGLSASDLDLEAWPTITFVMRGPDRREVPLVCQPATYWQVDSPARGLAAFTFYSSGMSQAILGLPLMNNYYTVFDRSTDAYGVIRFAPIAPAAVSG